MAKAFARVAKGKKSKKDKKRKRSKKKKKKKGSSSDSSTCRREQLKRNSLFFGLKRNREFFSRNSQLGVSLVLGVFWLGVSLRVRVLGQLAARGGCPAPAVSRGPALAYAPGPLVLRPRPCTKYFLHTHLLRNIAHASISFYRHPHSALDEHV
jgi:hypothetical protein